LFKYFSKTSLINLESFFTIWTNYFIHIFSFIFLYKIYTHPNFELAKQYVNKIPEIMGL